MLRRGIPDPNWPLRRNFVLLSVPACSIAVGIVLFATTVAGIGWLLSIEIDDGLEGLLIPATTWLAGTFAIGVERVGRLAAGGTRQRPSVPSQAGPRSDR